MPQSVDLVIFGGTGDLSMRKLLPALYRADVERALADDARIFLLHRHLSDSGTILDQVQQTLARHLMPGEFGAESWQRLRSRIHTQALDLAQPDSRWADLTQRLGLSSSRVRLFYLAIPPHLYGTVCDQLAAMGLIGANARVVLEKPIGYDLASARAINHKVARHFQEEQIYRIDHYVGKETVQNLLALRFTNTLFEDLWDSRNIDHVQITLSETVGLEGRADFYDRAGAMRDMVQNHLLQLLALVTMEPPRRMDAANIRAEKLKLLQALRPIREADVSRYTVRGQYVAGHLGGSAVPGYADELGAQSSTETYVAVQAHVDNWRWARVPFFLRTGKRLKERYAEIIVQYRPVSHVVCSSDAGELQPNRLVIRLQPEESIQLTLMAKVMNRPDMHLRPVTLNLNFADEPGRSAPSDAYKYLLLDAAAGNPALFTHRDEVEAAWAWVDPILEAWRSNGEEVHPYSAGSWGPAAATELLKRADRHWYGSREAMCATA